MEIRQRPSEAQHTLIRFREAVIVVVVCWCGQQCSQQSYIILLDHMFDFELGACNFLLNSDDAISVSFESVLTVKNKTNPYAF